MRRGMFYAEWNIFLRLDYEIRGKKQFKDYQLPTEQYVKGKILNSGLFLNGCYPDETKKFSFVVNTGDLAKF